MSPTDPTRTSHDVRSSLTQLNAGLASGAYQATMSVLLITAMAIEVGALAAAVLVTLQSTADVVRH
jgi:hypothetical protein